MADKTVLDFPELLDTNDDDVLYVIRGTGIGRDRYQKRVNFLQPLLDELNTKVEEIAYSRHDIGELFFLAGGVKPLSAFSGSPSTFFGGICLDTINKYTDINETNHPDFVPALRASTLKYLEGTASEKSAFSVIAWAISSNVATLTFASATEENAIIDALSEDNLVHGNFVGWRSITIPISIGSITAGEYAITDVDSTLNKISFAFTAPDSSGVDSGTALFYTNRIPGSATTARLYQASARTLVSANDTTSENICGLRRRDRGQGHWHEQWFRAFNVQAGTAATIDATGGTATGKNTDDRVRASISDGVHGNSRIGSTTDPRSLIGHLYIWGGNYQETP